jgi:acyl-homoserine lactone acylase PvdQ
MYAALVDDTEVTDEELTDYFHDGSIAADVVESEYEVGTGITVQRDAFGIPHVSATTDEGAFFGLGYVTAEDRLWHMDVLRHAARGELASLLGPGLVGFDRSIRRDFYSRAEYSRIFERLDERFGSDGAAIQDVIRSYSDGVNARIAEIRAGTVSRPPEYLLQGIEAEDWDPLDSVILAIFQLRSFGSGGGEELTNASLLQTLRKRLGAEEGRLAFEDLAWDNDPISYPSVPPADGSFPSQDLGAVNPKAVALPKGIRPVSSVGSSRAALENAVTLRAPSSNFMAVDGAHSETGNPLQFGGPQVGYSAPQFFMEIAVDSPGFAFRGPALPGASFGIPLGHNRDVAWSMTSGNSDLVDTRAELLCAKRNRKVTMRSNRYVFKGRCRAMTRRKETIEVKGGDSQTMTVRRTVHGPVIGRAKVGRKPVALVDQRAYWGKEFDFVVQAMPLVRNQVTSAQDFLGVLDGIPMSFNAIYSGPDGIAYAHVGRYPVRKSGVDPMLPSWGTGKWEWKGRLPFSANPQTVYPEQGWIVNWNNRPSEGWRDGDSSRWGPTHRVGYLRDSLSAHFADGGTASLAEVVDVIRDVATTDGIAYFIAEDMIAAAGETSGNDATALGLIETWVAEGADRTDRDHDGEQDHGAAVAVFDAWYDRLARAIFDDELGDAGAFGLPIAHRARPGGSSYYSDFSNYVWHLLNQPDNLRLDYCDDRSTAGTETCSEMVAATLGAAVASISEAQGGDPSTWTAPADHIVFDENGAVSVDPIPWQNRGTYNHAIEILTGN